MTDDHARDALLAQLQTEVAALRAEVRRPQHRRRPMRRFLPLALAALLVALVPLATLAANPFTDLDPAQNSPGGHNPNIDAIYTAGITTGCDPTRYCPKDPVTREQMASFLARTAGLGTNPPVANAKTLQGLAPSGLLRVARVSTGSGSTIAVTGTDNAYQSIATVAITVPGPGFVLVNGALTGRNTGNMCGTNCPIHARLRDAANGTTSPYLSALVTNNVADIPLSPVEVFPVSAPGPRTFVLEVSKTLSGYMGVSVADVNLTALYVPFGYDGGTSLAP